MRLLQRLFQAPDRGTAPRLYAAIVARGREPHWYEAGAVPDTIDGRFDMIAAVMSLVLLRLEQDDAAIPFSTQLTEVFIDDMDGQLRQIGIGDIVVGKHVGKMMGMLGGRLGAYRAALADGTLGEALVRNLYRGEAPAPEALAHVEAGLRTLRDQLAETPIDTLREGVLA
ncbi:ubiquinol-cytochrome C chaperone family protein [Sphingomonas sp. HITSZ_GF]|uniref:ubiquinol-cytochrome C chaperone family protein n=1 Tax=Sphingomonas sp. HITSZ_GF TaxID=3037247 RepID=UPI00240DDF77|nr:ubiquinol-cytochrome C chaperone family protein [Sphingomonas sp. HITSZ_GF]MDG2534378.1 ubiquinol-cytochrome C chaperone family protein [Sphingomonas sp. HITSZ_GF]